MYVIDARHYLDDKGGIAPGRGPARKMADFVTAVIARASNFDRADDTAGPVCFRCRKRDHRRVDTGITEDDVVVWHCPACGTQGRISDWQRTFWDLSQGSLSD
jgi:ribosomal protein L37AE/L43A